MDNKRPPAKMQPPGRIVEKQYDLAEFTRRHGISAVKAKEILERAGDSRESADLLAKRSKPSESQTY